MIHKKVKFRGEIYWLHNGWGDSFNISPLDHYTESGELEANPFRDVSYAILESDGKIRRYGEVIGDKSDLEDVE